MFRDLALAVVINKVRAIQDRINAGTIFATIEPGSGPVSRYQTVESLRKFLERQRCEVRAKRQSNPRPARKTRTAEQDPDPRFAGRLPDPNDQSGRTILVLGTLGGETNH
ncbi:MAG: hypothetical protein ACK5TM_11175, partial [Methylobacterium sp.]